MLHATTRAPCRIGWGEVQSALLVPGVPEAFISPFACHLDAEATRSNVAGLHEILVERGLARPANLEEAEVVLCEWSRFAHLGDLRRDRRLAYRLNQVPNATRELHRKERFAQLMRRRPHVLETYVESAPRKLKGLWVEKPFNVDRGKGIGFLRDPRGWRRPGYVLQRYLDTPWLVDGRKVEVRVVALIFDDGSARVHREGLVRCAHRPFRMDDLDPLIHNSNPLFQLRQGVERLEQHLLTDLVSDPAMLDAMTAFIEDTVEMLRRRRCFEDTQDFEMVGYDFILDQDGYPWALEANRFPGLHFGTPVADRFYLGVIEDLYSGLVA